MTLFALTNKVKDTNRITYIHHFETLLNKKVRDFLYLCQMMASHVIHLYSNKVINIQIAYSVVNRRKN